MDVELAAPPGTRSCGTGGSWDQCRAAGKHNTNYWIAEYEALRRQLAPADERLLKAELRSKMQRAEIGDLVYGRDRDVVQMQVCQIVLEIRLRTKVATGGGERVVRLYFSEPHHEDGMLLAAKLAWKTPMGKAEQNDHALEAGKRVRSHFP